eukprot:313514_1
MSLNFPIYAFVFWSLLLCSLDYARPFKTKRKYPFYRPNYNSTKPIFEPFFNVMQNPSVANDNMELYEYLSNRLNPFISYHNYTQYMQEINYLIQLSESTLSPWFPILSIKEESQSVDNNPLHRIILTDKSIPNNNKQKILMIFGEHPREFIVSESMIDLLSNILLSYISSSNIFTKQYIDNILSYFEIHIIPMLNPDGKIALETSLNYCWRWNSKQHQVDLNRNFDWYFAGKKGSTHKKGTEEWHGIKAFSEPEAKYVYDLLYKYNYSVVLDIHSGTQQIFVPFVDTESRKTKRTRPETDEELHLVKYIQNNSKGWYKNSGIAWKYNDYGADGTIMDYVGGVAKVKYSLCVEIYGDPTVDNSIDCFVQFNPNNGKQFQESMEGIRTLYTGTFDYFLTVEHRLASNMISSARLLQEYLLNVAKK